MGDLCFDVFGIAKEKKDPTSIKGNRATNSQKAQEDGETSVQSVEVFSYLHQQANQTRPYEAQEASSAELQEETARRRHQLTKSA